MKDAPAPVTSAAWTLPVKPSAAANAAAKKLRDMDIGEVPAWGSRYRPFHSGFVTPGCQSGFNYVTVSSSPRLTSAAAVIEGVQNRDRASWPTSRTVTSSARSEEHTSELQSFMRF